MKRSFPSSIVLASNKRMPVTASLQWRARLRAEYRWPYPALEPRRWYPLRASAVSFEPGKYVWLDVEPYPVEVFAEHLEPVRLEHELAAVPPSGAMPEATEPRLARLRVQAAERYPDLPAGVWIEAAEVAAMLVLTHALSRRPSGRRRRRLPDADFEFRTDESRSD